VRSDIKDILVILEGWSEVFNILEVISKRMIAFAIIHENQINSIVFMEFSI